MNDGTDVLMVGGGQISRKKWTASGGAPLREIVRWLMDKGIPAPRGGKTWHIEAIHRILNNEKYYGDVCLQKTYIADYFTGK